MVAAVTNSTVGPHARATAGVCCRRGMDGCEPAAVLLDVDRRKSLHAEVIAGTRAQFPAMLATEVPYSSEIERMTQTQGAVAGICAAQCRGVGVRSAVGRSRGAAGEIAAPYMAGSRGIPGFTEGTASSGKERHELPQMRSIRIACCDGPARPSRSPRARQEHRPGRRKPSARSLRLSPLP